MTTSAPPQHKIKLVAGAEVAVMHPDEVDWFNQQKDQYLLQTKFTERTDLADLDRLLVMELMIYRWTVWITRNTDYDGDMVDDERLRRNIKEYSDQINKIKTAMGLTKQARDEAANDGNFAAWLSDLKARAKIFGVHREKQLTKALALFMELTTVIGTFDRADAEERRKIGFETEVEIVEWIRDVALPEFQELDAHFRANEQRYWVRDQ